MSPTRQPQTCPFPAQGGLLVGLLALSATLLLGCVWGCGPKHTGPGDSTIVQRLIEEDPYELFNPTRLGTRRPLFTWTFTSPEDLRPWKPRKGGSPLNRQKNYLLIDLGEQGTSLGRAVELEAAEVDLLRVRISGLRKGELRLQWADATDPMDRSRRTVLQARQSDPNDPDSFTFEMRRHPHWQGSIRRLRFTFHGPPDQKLRLRSIGGSALELNSEALSSIAGRAWKVDLEQDVRNALVALPGLPLERQVEVPKGGAWLRFAYGRDSAATAPLTFKVLATEGQEEARLLFAEPVPLPSTGSSEPGEKGGEQSPAWRQARIDLGKFSGQRLRLTFLSEGPRENPLDALAYWANPEILARQTKNEAPNLILVVLDTLRADHLSLYGYERPTTPNIDAWARAHGITFRNTVAAAPWTLPSHISLFTGLDALSHGLNHDRPAPPSLSTLPERLRAAGYSTMAITGGVYLDPRYGLHQGFDRFRYWPSGKPQKEELAAHMEAALATLRDATGQPFFLFFHTYEIHSPFEARQPFLQRLAGKENAAAEALSPKLASRILPLEDSEGYTVRRRFILKQRHSTDPPTLAPSSLPEVRSLYDAGIAYVDHHMGRLFQTLEETGLMQDTAIVLTSDHGEALGERGHAGHSYLYDHNLMVPFVLAQPGGKNAGESIERQVRSIDIPATLLALAGLAPDPTMDGTSLLGLLGNPGAPGPQEAWSYASSSNFGISLRLANRLKYTYNNTAWQPVRGRQTLLRLADDPAEMHNLESLESEEAARLQERLRQRYSSSFKGLRADIHSSGPLAIRFNGARFLATAKVKVVDSASGAIERLGKGIEARLPGAGSLSLFFESAAPSDELLLEALRPGLPPCRHRLSLSTLTGPWQIDLTADHCDLGARGQFEQSLKLTLESPLSATTPTLAIDPEMEEKLRALGYLD